MYLNVIINDRVNVKVAPVSIAEMRSIQKDVREKSIEADGKLQEVITTGDQYLLDIANAGDIEILAIEQSGDQYLVDIAAAGATELSQITNAADVEILRVEASGDAQDARVVAEGDTQVARVIAEGDTQEARSTLEADRAEDAADAAEASADEIKAVGVVSPVTSVPLLPDNVTGVPTVTYDDLTGLFTYGIPVGKTGEAAQVVIPTGAVTVAELNALVADPDVGAGYWMLDTGTVTYGDPDCIVIEAKEVLVWLADGYFFNMGILSVGSSWPGISDVTVESAAPQAGDDLARTGTSYTKTEQDAADLIQTNAIALNTAKLTGSDRVLKAGDTMTGQLKGITPVADEDFSIKEYVDTKLSSTGGLITGDLTIYKALPKVVLQSSSFPTRRYEMIQQADGTYQLLSLDGSGTLVETVMSIGIDGKPTFAKNPFVTEDQVDDPDALVKKETLDNLFEGIDPTPPVSIVSSTDPFEDGSLRHKFEMEDYTATVGADASNDSVSFTTPGVFANAGSFTLGTRLAVSLSNIGSNIFSYSVFLNPTISGEQGYILDFQTGRGILSCTDGVLGFYSGSVWYDNLYSLSTGSFSHVVLTSDGNEIVIYVDKVEVNRFVGSPQAISGQFGIGGTSSASVSSYTGLMDQLEIYNKVLSQEEIDALFIQEIPGAGAGVIKEYIDNANALQDAEIVKAVISEPETQGIGTDRVNAVVSCTQVEYDAMTPPRPASTLYIVVG